MKPNTIVTLSYPAEPPPAIELVPLPNHERVKNPILAKDDVRRSQRNGNIWVRAQWWQWEVLAWAIEALREKNAD